jgi:signal transduction histidine kinase
VPADWVTPREAVRLVAVGLLLGGVCLRYAKVQRRRAYTAVCSERERIARDLHDGLAQDLVCITTQAQRLDCRLGPDDPLLLATRDALAEVRGMIVDLTSSTAFTSEAAAPLIAHERGHPVDVRVNVRINVRSEAGSVPTMENRTPQTRPGGLARTNSSARGMSRLSRERRAKLRRAA